jgi:hypothetical protein
MGGRSLYCRAQPQIGARGRGGLAGLEAARTAALRGHHVQLHEAANDIGGQFRLAGLQPRRGQILDLLAWYEREFTRAGVVLHCNSYLDTTDIAAHPADVVIIAMGSLTDENGVQRWRPDLPRLLGIDLGSNWRGVGTAWYLAEKGHAVTIITPEPFCRARYCPHRRRRGCAQAARAAWRAVSRRALPFGMAWHGNGASLHKMLTGAQSEIPASALIMCTTNRAFDPFPQTMAGKTLQRICDCMAPLLAAYAFHEGRKAALSH